MGRVAHTSCVEALAREASGVDEAQRVAAAE